MSLNCNHHLDASHLVCPVAFEKISVSTDLSFVQVTGDVAQMLGEQKVDAILCVAGGWAGGNCSSKGQSSTFLFAVTLINS